MTAPEPTTGNMNSQGRQPTLELRLGTSERQPENDAGCFSLNGPSVGRASRISRLLSVEASDPVQTRTH